MLGDMRDPEIFHEALRMLGNGQNAHEVATILGVPWGTVRYWHQGRRDEARRVNGSGPTPVQCSLGKCPWMSRLDGAAYTYLLGAYLGDGTIQKVRRTAQLRVFLDDGYPAIQNEVADAMATATGATVSRGRRPGCTAVSSYSIHWRCVFPQHGTGRKHLREIWLADWQQRFTDEYPEQLLRGLIHTDGCRSRNIVKGKDYPKYEFKNQSLDIHVIFQQAARSLGLRYTMRAGRTGAVTAIARRADVAIMDRIVGPKC